MKRIRRHGLDFGELVDKTPGHGPNGDCWIWTGASLKIHPITGRGGYGTFRGGEDKVLAHRHSYLLSHGILPNDLQVLHSCDIRLCVNPSHLFLGTAKDNTRDMIEKGRDALLYKKRGMSHPSAKIDEATVREARGLFKQGWKQVDIAGKLKINNRSIWHIVHGVIWTHVE